jgi:hypothetical protein
MAALKSEEDPRKRRWMEVISISSPIAVGIYMGIMHIVYIGSKKKAVKYLGKLYSDLHDAHVKSVVTAVWLH